MSICSSPDHAPSNHNIYSPSLSLPPHLDDDFFIFIFLRDLIQILYLIQVLHHVRVSKYTSTASNMKLNNW
ncbi:hypothetical protein L2E82_39071 [Cichorium intybus]|uniref:Uncharacterized protein n=1 Tax=Cichorium intybus TaxID=13427 RepID=A0ACB9AH69_CICIN|nr:hypothetical protein L2E82_39071 [Cichorium intybus]